MALVPLDVTDSRSVKAAAGEIGGRVDILINTAEVHRVQGIASRSGVESARAEMDVNYFGLLRLAQEFGAGDARTRRGRHIERDGVGQHPVDLRARELSAARNLFRLQGGRALALAMPARRDAAGRHPGRQCVSGSDRR